MSIEFEKVELSPTVGPDPIILMSSPTTSDKMRVTIFPFPSTYVGSLPPLIFDKCFLTVLISFIDAPDFNNNFVITCFDLRSNPSNGEQSKEEDPPDISTNIKDLL